MRIAFSRNDLFEQMPREVKRAMVGSKIPEKIELEIETFEIGNFPNEPKLRRKYPTVYSNFTQTEWYMFCCLMTFNGEVQHSVLGAKLNNNGANFANVVSVHVKSVRRKLKELGVPLQVKTFRGGPERMGGYMIKKI